MSISAMRRRQKFANLWKARRYRAIDPRALARLMPTWTPRKKFRCNISLRSWPNMNFFILLVIKTLLFASELFTTGACVPLWTFRALAFLNHPYSGSLFDISNSALYSFTLSSAINQLFNHVVAMSYLLSSMRLAYVHYGHKSHYLWLHIHLISATVNRYIL